MEGSFTFADPEIPGNAFMNNKEVDISAQWQFGRWLSGVLNFNMLWEITSGDAKGPNHLRQTPSFTCSGGLTAELKKGFFITAFYWLNRENANPKDQSAQAMSDFLPHLMFSYRVNRFEFCISGESLFRPKRRDGRPEKNTGPRFETEAVSERLVNGSISFYF